MNERVEQIETMLAYSVSTSFEPCVRFSKVPRTFRTRKHFEFFSRPDIYGNHLALPATIMRAGKLISNFSR